MAIGGERKLAARAVMKEYLTDLVTTVPPGVPAEVVAERRSAERQRIARLIESGRLLRLWRTHDGTRTIGLWRAMSEADLRDAVLDTLPLRPWMRITVTALDPHPNAPAAPRPRC